MIDYIESENTDHNTENATKSQRFVFVKQWVNAAYYQDNCPVPSFEMLNVDAPPLWAPKAVMPPPKMAPAVDGRQWSIRLEAFAIATTPPMDAIQRQV